MMLLIMIGGRMFYTCRITSINGIIIINTNRIIL